MDRAAEALNLGRSGMNSTSDFPYLLADVANKVLRAAYAEAPQTWMPISKDVALADFKPSNQLQVGDAPKLLEVLEHGEFKSGTIAEAKEALQLKTYGRKFAITRQALINDDTGAFADVPAAFGRMARNLESDLAWAQITANPTMGDSHSLFDATYHANYDDTGAVISVEAIGIGRAAMRTQTGIDGVTVLNLNPLYLIVPAALETLADQFVSVSLMASAPGSINPFAGRLQVIAEPRLDADSELHWYLATDVAQCPVLLHGYLEGETGPTVEQRIGFDIDGLEIKCRLDVGFKAADWRGIYKNAGAS
jgi:phage major head subunit gpT-like protein